MEYLGLVCLTVLIVMALVIRPEDKAPPPPASA